MAGGEGGEDIIRGFKSNLGLVLIQVWCCDQKAHLVTWTLQLEGHVVREAKTKAFMKSSGCRNKELERILNVIGRHLTDSHQMGLTLTDCLWQQRCLTCPPGCPTADVRTSSQSSQAV